MTAYGLLWVDTNGTVHHNVPWVTNYCPAACVNSIANALELPQSCTKPLIQDSSRHILAVTIVLEYVCRGGGGGRGGGDVLHKHAQEAHCNNINTTRHIEVSLLLTEFNLTIRHGYVITSI